MGGGVAHSQCHIRAGSAVTFEFQSGLRRIHARVLAREGRPQELAFELVKIGYQDRSRLRPLLGLRSLES